MSGVNKVILVGHVGRDPEIRRTQDGRPVATFSIATSESWKDKTTGERKEATEWHNVVIFNEGLCDVVEKYVKKGSKLYVEGQQKTRKWRDEKIGADRYTTETVLQSYRGSIVLLDRKEGGRSEDGYGQADESAPPTDRAPDGPAAAAAKPTGGKRDDMDDEIPF